MLTMYKKLNDDDIENIKKYRKIGYDACVHGVDRKVADDFPVQYRSSFKHGWDQANADALFSQVSRMTLRPKHRG